MKKGAMFGLDARIALAIFGALSVISGAALYSAIQESKVTAYYTSSQEIIKAMEALYLDTGSLRLHGGDLNACFDSTDLITDNGLKGWAGPYISATGAVSDGNSNDCIMLQGVSGFEGIYSIRVRHFKNAAWDFSISSWFNGLTCSGSGDCGLFINLTSPSSFETIAAEMDRKFDDGDSEVGNVRYKVSGVNTYTYIRGFNYN